MTREQAIEVLIIKANKGDFVEDIIHQIFDYQDRLIKHKDDIIDTLVKELEKHTVSKIEI